MAPVAHVARWDREMRLRTASSAFAAFAGRPASELAGLHARDVLGPEMFELNRPYAERALTGVTQGFDRSIVDRHGRTRHLHALFIPEIVDGTVDGFWAVVSDLTAESDPPVADATSESVYRRAFLASPVGKAIFDEAGNLLQANPALAELLGWEPGEQPPQRVLDLLAEDERDDERERIAELFAGHLEQTAAERRLRGRDGSVVWVIRSLALSEGGPSRGPLAIAQFQDIQARKQAETDLRESRSRLNEAERVARMGSWSLDIASGRGAWSDGLYEIFGMTPGDIEVWLEDAYTQRIYPDDRDRVRAVLERAIADRSDYDIEFRIVRADGRVRTVRSRGEVLVNAAGEPERMIGIAQDVTEAAATRDALERAGADMESRALELQRLARTAADSEEPASPRAQLSRRQLEILELVADGMTNASIAQRLFLSEATVKWHLKQILHKTGSSNRAEAVARVLGLSHRQDGG